MGTELPEDWGVFRWFEESGTHLIHPDDLNTMRRIVRIPGVKLFRCISDDGDFLALQYRQFVVRARRDLFVPKPAPRKAFGETATVRKGGAELIGTICDINWHFKESRPYYHIEVRGRRLKKRYWDEDFAVREV